MVTGAHIAAKKGGFLKMLGLSGTLGVGAAGLIALGGVFFGPVGAAIGGIGAIIGHSAVSLADEQNVRSVLTNRQVRSTLSKSSAYVRTATAANVYQFYSAGLIRSHAVLASAGAGLSAGALAGSGVLATALGVAAAAATTVFVVRGALFGSLWAKASGHTPSTSAAGTVAGTALGMALSIAAANHALSPARTQTAAAPIAPPAATTAQAIPVDKAAADRALSKGFNGIYESERNILTVAAANKGTARRAYGGTAPALS